MLLEPLQKLLPIVMFTVAFVCQFVTINELTSANAGALVKELSGMFIMKLLVSVVLLEIQ